MQFSGHTVIHKVCRRFFVKEACACFMFIFACIYFVADFNWKKQNNKSLSFAPYFWNSDKTHSLDTINCPRFSYARGLQTIFIITPTYQRWTQKADLTRLSQTLRLVPRIHWIVVEDSKSSSASIEQFLKTSCLSYTHLFISTSISSSNARKPYAGRGMDQRNLALGTYVLCSTKALKMVVLSHQPKALKYFMLSSIHILAEDNNPYKNFLRHRYNSSKGVVYFADDDNTYDVRLFNYIRKVKMVGVWPVGLIGISNVEHATVINKTVVGWQTTWGRRLFAVDMAGFAINMKQVLKSFKIRFSRDCKPGYHEDCFLRAINISLHDLEPFGLQNSLRVNDRLPVYVWHTKTARITPRKIIPEFDV